MKKITSICFIATFLFSGFNLYAQTLLHYWNFNNPASVQTISTPSVSLVSTASLTHTLGASTLFDHSKGTGNDFDLNNLNSKNNDIAGTHLRFNDPIGGSL